MKISIIICFYDRIDYLTPCLDSLRSESRYFDEVVVADDGSGEEIVASVRSMQSRYDFPLVHAWHSRDGSRRAATRNNGIRNSTGEYLIFFDADFAALPGAVRSHVEAAKPRHFAAGRCKYTTEGQARRILSQGVSTNLLEATYRELPDEPIEKEHRRFIRYALLRRIGLGDSRKVTFGGHFSAFREDIESVNGYDENYAGWGAEDMDIAHRMVLAGFRGTSVIRTARMLHLWHSREMGERHWREGDNVEYFFRRTVPVRCETGLFPRGE